MKLHDLRPASGSVRERVRVGRGIAAGRGKTAGRGTKGQKSRAGASIPAWFEGGQTPIQMRVPKLRGFRNRFKIDYEVVNVGRIAEAIAAGRFADAEEVAAGMADGARRGRRAAAAPLTINPEVLRAAGVIATLRKPVKILGRGEIDRPLFVLADAFSASARAKIEAAGGSIQVLAAPGPEAVDGERETGGSGDDDAGSGAASDDTAE
jgi:large subunit ribosomal protein L15